MRHPINLLLTPLCALCAAGGAWAQPEAEEEGWGEESTEAGWGEDLVPEIRDLDQRIREQGVELGDELLLGLLDVRPGHV